MIAYFNSDFCLNFNFFQKMFVEHSTFEASTIRTQMMFVEHLNIVITIV